LGSRCGADVARALVECVGTDAGVLASEMAKLVTAVSDGPIAVAHVTELVASAVEETPYSWYHALAGRHTARAPGRLTPIMLNPEYPAVRLLIGLGAHLTQVAVARARLDAGEKASDVTRSLGGWMGERYVQQARSWTGQTIAAALVAVADADLAVKRGANDTP